jgi:hypothetical protein
MSWPRKRQHGAALLALLAVIALASAWFLVSRMNTLSAEFKIAEKNRNAAVLNRAKQALIGYVAAQAVKGGENNPGALPCPEAPASFNSTSGTDGRAQSPCTLPAVGRFPWRTIGTEKLVDASGEPLWYVVSPGWAYTGTNTLINSDSTGQLTVDGVANDAVALIIAPGPAFSVAAASGCSARSQARPATGTPDWRNYLECENASSPADSVFVSTGPEGSFNDQLVKISAAELLPGIEAAVAQRFEREIAPQIRSTYSNSDAANPNTQWPATNPVLPFAAAFASPAASAFKGSAATFCL